MNRSSFLVASGTLPFIQPSLIEAQTLAHVRVGVATSSGYTVPIARDTGMFAKAGIEVEITGLGQGAAVAAAIVGHSIDVGLAGVLTVAQARDKGLPFAIIAPDTLYQSAMPDSAFVVLPDSPIRSARDLNGKVVGTRTITGIFRLAMDAWIDQNGGDTSTVKYIEIPPPESMAALQRGTVAAALVADPLLTNIRAQVRSIGNPMNAFGPKNITTAWFATSDWIAQNRRTAAAFARVILEANKWTNDAKNHGAAQAIIARFAPLETAYGATVFQESMDPKLIQPVLDLGLKYKQLQKPMTAGELIASL